MGVVCAQVMLSALAHLLLQLYVPIFHTMQLRGWGLRPELRFIVVVMRSSFKATEKAAWFSSAEWSAHWKPLMKRILDNADLAPLKFR